MVVPTGCEQLDTMLGGGLPEQRAVLVTGGPGVGKSTLAMQFLQEGLEQDERGLYISTEQTADELRTSFAPFDFDLDHPDLTITSLHASPSTTLEESQSGLALQSLQGDGSIDGPYAYPFESEYIVEFLEQFAPSDRVVLDSTSGLSAISDNQEVFRRTVLDLVRLFTDQYEATTVLTAEEAGASQDGSTVGGASQLLQFTANGVVRLHWDRIRGSRRRYLEVMKMRGIDHDTRRFELDFDSRGVFLTPVQRTSASGIDPEAVISTGSQGLDELSGGFVRGHSVLLESDGRALVDHVVASIMSSAFEEGMSVWFFPSPIMKPGRIEDLMHNAWTMEELLDDGVLSVLDGFGAWKDLHDHEGVFSAPSGILGNLFRRSSTVRTYLMQKMAEQVDARRGDTPHMGVVYTEAFLRWLEPDQVKEVYYWAREKLADEFDTGFFIHNPTTMEEQLAEFFHSDAVQVFEATMDDDGIQRIHLTKSPIGKPGQSAVLDYREDGVTLG